MTASDGIPARRRVLYIYQSPYPWDVRVEKICQALLAADFDVHIGAAGGDGRPEIETLPDGMTVHRLSRNGKRPLPTPFSAAWQAFCSRLDDAIKPDITIIRDLPLVRQAVRASSRRGIPVVFDMAENYPALNEFVQSGYKKSLLGVLFRNRRLGHLYEAWAFNRVAITFTVVEESTERILALGAKPERVVVISNTPRLASIQWPRTVAPRAPGEPLRLLYVGQIEPLRGLETVVRALPMLVHVGVNASLTIVGDDGVFGPGLRAVAREIGVETSVTFVGRVPNEEIYRYIEHSDIGVIPHVKNDFTDATIPNKLFDYMLGGLPVIVSNARPMARVVHEEACGVIFNAGDSASFAEALSRLVRVPSGMKEAGARARAAAERRYHWEFDAAAVREAVGRVLAGG